MTDEQSTIIVIGDDMPEETREMLQRELGTRGINHRILIAMAGALAASAHISDLLEDLGRMVTQIRIPEISPSILAAKDHFDAAPLPPYYRHYSAQARMKESNLNAHYNHAAKWGSGAHNAGHRSRENRHAEAQRNVAAYNKRYNKG